MTGRRFDAYSVIVAAWHMLTASEVYRDAGGDYFHPPGPDKHTRRLVVQLEHLGHIVPLKQAAA